MNNIPIILNNFNRLSTTKKLVEDLRTLGYFNIHILDNNSTYKPLLEWYSEISNGNRCEPVKVYRIGHNSGQLALWNTGYINQFLNEPYIVYSDSDIELNRLTQKGFIEELIKVSEAYRGRKVGLALQIDDLPDNELGNRIKNHEGKYWEDRLLKLCSNDPSPYNADIDTTFAVIRPTEPFTYKAIRVAGDFTAKHIPWYTDWSNLSEEERYVLDHLDNKYSTYKGYYLQWLENKQ